MIINKSDEQLALEAEVLLDTFKNDPMRDRTAKKVERRYIARPETKTVFLVQQECEGIDRIAYFIEYVMKDEVRKYCIEWLYHQNNKTCTIREECRFYNPKPFSKKKN